MRPIKIMSATILIVLLTGSVWALDIYVERLNGDDTAHGGTSPDDAFRTIPRAIQAATASADASDRIYVLQGVYTENIVIPAGVSHPLLIKGIGKVEIKPPGVGPTERAGGTGITVQTGATFTVDNLYIQQWSGYGIDFEGSSSGFVMNCRILQNYTGANVASSGLITFEFSLVTPFNAPNSDSEGITFRSGSGTTIITRCTVMPHRFGSVGSAFGSSAAETVRIRNSIAFGSIVSNGGNDYNDVTVPTGPHDVSVDPQFIGNFDFDIPERAFMLKPTSPLIGAGDEGGLPVTIGAYGVGVVARAVGDPAIPFTDFHNWMEPSGTPAGTAASSFDFDGSGRLVLKPGVTAGTIQSPVFDAGNGTPLYPYIKSITFKAFESADTVAFTSGVRRVVDDDATTIQREIKFRASAATFSPLAANPTFQSTFRGEQVNNDGGLFQTGPGGSIVFRPGNLQNTGRYMQVQITLRRDGK